MLLTDLIVCTEIPDDCELLDKTGMVHRLLLRLAQHRHLDAANVPSILEALMRRESLGSTGIGQGIAIPHTRHLSVCETIGIMAICRHPLDFDSIDGALTDIFVLVLAPHDRPGFESSATSRDSAVLLRTLMNPKFQKRMRASISEQEIRDILAEFETYEFD